MLFRLIERTSDLRVVLAGPTQEVKGTLIREIKAPTWLDARLTIPDIEFAHDPGHGYFINPPAGSYERQLAAESRRKADVERLAKIVRENIEKGRSKSKGA